MMEDSVSTPLLCPKEFTENAEYFLNVIYGVTLNDITHQNCEHIYLALVIIIETIIDSFL